MLELYDKNHVKLAPLTKIKNLKKESDLQDFSKTLSFTFCGQKCDAEPECYVRTKDDEYVIKEKNYTSNGFLEYVAVLNLEDLESRAWVKFSVEGKTIEQAASLALDGTGWTVGKSTVTKTRSASIMLATSKNIIEKLCTAFMCECVFDTINKTISFYNEVGEDKGVYFLPGLNLKKLLRKDDSYDYYTRIVPIGANGLTIEQANGGKDYLENYQYSEKIRVCIWKDESYTDPQALMEDAELKLEDLSKPAVAYQTDVIDLAKQNSTYSVFEYGLGDRITLIDATSGIRDKQRIVKLVEYPQTPSKNNCELANMTLTFEEMQQKYKDAMDIINAVINSDGRYTGQINVSDILNFGSGVAGSDAITNVQESIGGMGGEVKEVKEAIEGIEGDITDIKEGQENAEKDMAQIKKDIEDLKTDENSMAQIKERIEKLEEIIKNAIIAV